MIFSEEIQSESYDFLKSNEHLGNNLMLLGVAGSFSYGTNTEGSDLDLVGVAVNRKSDLLGLTSFDIYRDDKTDTSIYGLKHYVKLLIEGNPSAIEFLGLKDELYLKKTDLGEMLLASKELFLCENIAAGYIGYASGQHKRLLAEIRKGSMDDTHINKMAMHLIRRCATGEQILREGKIVTFRKEEHDLLMRIRLGEYFDRELGLKKDYEDIFTDYYEKLKRTAENSRLIKPLNREAVEQLLEKIHELSLS